MRALLIGIFCFGVLLPAARPAAAQWNTAQPAVLKIYVTDCSDAPLILAQVRAILYRGSEVLQIVNGNTGIDGKFTIRFNYTQCCDVAMVAVMPRDGGATWYEAFTRGGCNLCGPDYVDEWFQVVPGPICQSCCTGRWEEDRTYWHIRYRS